METAMDCIYVDARLSGLVLAGLVLVALCFFIVWACLKCSK